MGQLMHRPLERDQIISNLTSIVCGFGRLVLIAVQASELLGCREGALDAT